MDESTADVNLEPHEPAASAPADGAPVVFIAEGVLGDMNCHAAEETDHEIGGIMIGSVIGGDHPVVVVEASIRGSHLAYTRGSVTFTHDTWSEINRIKDEQYPDKRIVGWYHSHPGFGIFLSNYDLFIHKSFFTAPWQIAYVTDPKAKTYGCFTWQGGELAAEPGFQVAADPRGYQLSGSAPAPETPLVVQLPQPSAPVARDRGLMFALGFIGIVLAMLAALALANYGAVLKLDRKLGATPPIVAPAPSAPTTPAEPTAKPPASESPKPAAAEPPAPEAKPATGPATPAAPAEGRPPNARPGPPTS